MTISEVKNVLPQLDQVSFKLENGTMVPEHFHVTEVGVISKHFIDCGGVVRDEKMANFQLWNANDFDHRLKPMKLLNIIKLSENKLGLEDLEIEVEFQGETIGKYGLDFQDGTFILTNKITDCLAKDKCGIPEELIVSNQNSCTPGGGCC
jgi:hypothetical protein